MIVNVPLRLGNGGNDRLHWRAADRKKKAEKLAVGWMLANQIRPQLPCVVTITRIAPSNGLDADNLVSSCKYVQDSIARWLGIDDKDQALVRYVATQERGPWAVRITIEATP